MADAPSCTKPNNCFSSHQFEEKKEQTQKLKHLLQIEVMGWVQFAYVHSWFL